RNGRDSLLAFWLPLLSSTSPYSHSSSTTTTTTAAALLSLSLKTLLSLSLSLSLSNHTIMLLGKRQRPPMKRTTSMTEFTLDLNQKTVVDNSQTPHDHPSPPISTDATTLDHRFLSATVASKIHRRNSADFMETAHFLRACHLCKRRLIPGRDIFMYREKQMNQDEKKDVCSMASNKRNTHVATTSSNASETLAAM
ncbi:Protein of unknown function DUF581, partial [Cynara cardunculus var. scolymus]